MRTNFTQVSKLAAITIAAVASVVVPLSLLGVRPAAPGSDSAQAEPSSTLTVLRAPGPAPAHTRRPAAKRLPAFLPPAPRDVFAAAVHRRPAPRLHPTATPTHVAPAVVNHGVTTTPHVSAVKTARKPKPKPRPSIPAPTPTTTTTSATGTVKKAIIVKGDKVVSPPKTTATPKLPKMPTTRNPSKTPPPTPPKRPAKPAVTGPEHPPTATPGGGDGSGGGGPGNGGGNGNGDSHDPHDPGGSPPDHDHGNGGGNGNGNGGVSGNGNDNGHDNEHDGGNGHGH
jgi:translation initiation factor IF-2